MKVILYMAVTPNGMIARENDKTEWSKEESKAYIQKVKGCKNLVIGRRTYELMLKDSNKDADTKELGNPLVVVLTHNQKYKDKGNFKFVSSPQKALELLENAGHQQALVAGGSKTNTSFISEKLVDEIYLDVEPAIFGKGISLFELFDGEIKLNLLETQKLSNNQTFQLHYKVER